MDQVKGVYCFQVKGGPGGSEGKWIVDAKNGSGSVTYNGTGEADINGWSALFLHLVSVTSRL